MSFNFDLVWSSLPLIIQGLGMTLKLLFLSSLIGLVLAIVILLLRISERWYLMWPAMAYIYVFRGTPLLVQIFVIYHGLPQFDLVRESFLWPILREPFGCAVLALSLNAGAYVSEIMRGGIIGVDKGLKEAAMALGLPRWKQFIYVTSPIAIRLALPAYGNEVVSMLKATALASTITMMEMTGVARTLVARTFAPYEIFISAALIYLALTYVFQQGFAWIEAYASRYVKKER